MSRIFAVTVALVGLVAPANIMQVNQANGQSRSLHVHYFFTAETYLQMSSDLQKAYTIGIIDGRTTTSGGEWLSARLEEEHMTASQVANIVRKYVQEHPEHWQWPVATMANNAMLGACPSSPLNR